MKMDNKGMTIVEVMAGFMLLVVVTVSFVKTVKLASELTTASVDAKNNSSEFNYKYYSGNNYTTTYNKKTVSAFRDTASGIVQESGDKMKISITEWELNDVSDRDKGLYKEYQMNNEGKYEETIPDSSKITLLPDVFIQKVENIYDTDISRTGVYRYVKIATNN